MFNTGPTTALQSLVVKHMNMGLATYHNHETFDMFSLIEFFNHDDPGLLSYFVNGLVVHNNV